MGSDFIFAARDIRSHPAGRIATNRAAHGVSAQRAVSDQRQQNSTPMCTLHHAACAFKSA
jgi:hypothetical protein